MTNAQQFVRTFTGEKTKTFYFVNQKTMNQLYDAIFKQLSNAGMTIAAREPIDDALYGYFSAETTQTTPNANQQIEDRIKTFQAALDDPRTPAQQKAILQQMIAQYQAALGSGQVQPAPSTQVAQSNQLMQQKELERQALEKLEKESEITTIDPSSHGYSGTSFQCGGIAQLGIAQLVGKATDSVAEPIQVKRPGTSPLDVMVRHVFKRQLLDAQPQTLTDMQKMQIQQAGKLIKWLYGILDKVEADAFMTVDLYPEVPDRQGGAIFVTLIANLYDRNGNELLGPSGLILTTRSAPLDKFTVEEFVEKIKATELQAVQEMIAVLRPGAPPLSQQPQALQPSPATKISSEIKAIFSDAQDTNANTSVFQTVNVKGNFSATTAVPILSIVGSVMDPTSFKSRQITIGFGDKPEAGKTMEFGSGSAHLAYSDIAAGKANGWKATGGKLTIETVADKSIIIKVVGAVMEPNPSLGSEAKGTFKLDLTCQVDYVTGL